MSSFCPVNFVKWRFLSFSVSCALYPPLLIKPNKRRALSWLSPCFQSPCSDLSHVHLLRTRTVEHLHFGVHKNTKRHWHLSTWCLLASALILNLPSVKVYVVPTLVMETLQPSGKLSFCWRKCKRGKNQGFCTCLPHRAVLWNWARTNTGLSLGCQSQQEVSPGLSFAHYLWLVQGNAENQKTVTNLNW